MTVAQNLSGPAWLDIARGYIGLKEIKGPKHNSKILRMWDLIKCSWFKDDETPWCAGFVGACLEEAGIKSSRSAAALSYENFGVKLTRPAVGCIAVKKRKGGGHVTFVVGKTKSGKLLCLGGNQGDAVSIDEYDPSVFVTFRWPSIKPHDYRYELPVLLSSGKPAPTEA